MNLEDYNKNLDRMADWIKAVDQKVSIFLAFQGIVLTGILPVIFKELISNYCLLSIQQTNLALSKASTHPLL